MAGPSSVNRRVMGEETGKIVGAGSWAQVGGRKKVWSEKEFCKFKILRFTVVSDCHSSGVELNGIRGKEPMEQSNNCVWKPWKSLRMLGHVLKSLTNMEKFRKLSGQSDAADFRESGFH